MAAATLGHGLRDHGSGRFRRADFGNDDGRKSRLSRRDNGRSFDRRLRPLGAGSLGHGDGAGCRRRSAQRVGLDRSLRRSGGGYFAGSGGAVLVSKNGAAAMSGRQLPLILALGTTQTLAWASSYYLAAILADPIARDLGVSSNWVFAAFSASLVISALLGPRVGRQIDLVGGRSVLSLSNLVLAAGLGLLGGGPSIPVMVVAWLLLGVGMALGLYDAAFGALGRIYGDAARRSITGITLIAGFASTVGWALTAWGLETIGWRNTCFAWAAAHILIGLPINFFMLPVVKGAK